MCLCTTSTRTRKARDSSAERSYIVHSCWVQHSTLYRGSCQISQLGSRRRVICTAGQSHLGQGRPEMRHSPPLHGRAVRRCLYEAQRHIHVPLPNASIRAQTSVSTLHYSTSIHVTRLQAGTRIPQAPDLPLSPTASSASAYERNHITYTRYALQCPTENCARESNPLGGDQKSINPASERFFFTRLSAPRQPTGYE